MAGLETLDLSYNPKVEVILSPDVPYFESTRLVTNIRVRSDPNFMHWLMHLSEVSVLNQFKEQFISKIKILKEKSMT